MGDGDRADVLRSPGRLGGRSPVHRALGQYPLAIPWAPSDELLLVTSNITSFAEDWSLPEEEALLWVCARELASNSVLTRPGVRVRMEELLVDLAASARPRPNRT